MKFIIERFGSYERTETVDVYQKLLVEADCAEEAEAKASDADLEEFSEVVILEGEEWDEWWWCDEQESSDAIEEEEYHRQTQIAFAAADASPLVHKNLQCQIAST